MAYRDRRTSVCAEQDGLESLYYAESFRAPCFGTCSRLDAVDEFAELVDQGVDRFNRDLGAIRVTPDLAKQLETILLRPQDLLGPEYRHVVDRPCCDECAQGGQRTLGEVE